MVYKRDMSKLAKIIELRTKGCSMDDIGQQMDMTRQTVSAYLRTPEAQAIATELQTSILATLQSALGLVDKSIQAGDIVSARLMAVNLGKMVLAQTPVAQEQRDKLSPADRQALLDRIKAKVVAQKSIGEPINSGIDSIEEPQSGQAQ